MSNPLKFFAAGEPRSQGSMAPYMDPQTGRLRMMHAREPELRQWRSTVALAARAALNGARVLAAYEPCAVRIMFILPPARGRGRRQDLSLPSDKPDVDKLARGVLDACTGVLWVDDGQVTELTARKRYVQPGELPGAEIEVEAIQVKQRSLL